MSNSAPNQSLGSTFDGLHAAPRDRRSFLHLSGVGLAAAAMGIESGSGGQSTGKQRETERLVRRLLHAIESGSTAAIWAFVADNGSIEFPFSGARFTDFASFDAAIGPLLAVLQGLTFTEPVFEALDDPEALIAKYKGHAVVTFTGKSYDQTYITEIHTRRGKVTSYAEYFDTAVLNEAFTP